MRALILAGGKGARLRPLTDTTPKPLMPFMGAPFAVGLVRRLREGGVEHVTFLIGSDADPFAPLQPLGESLGLCLDFYVEERALGTAGAARRILRDAGGPVLICNGDILTDLDYRGLVGAHRRDNAAVTIALTTVDDPSSFGVAVTDAAGRVTRFVEKPPPGQAPALTVNAGTYVVDPNAVADFDGDGPLSFERDVFPALLADGALVGGFPSEAFWSDLGTPARYRAGHAAVLSGRCAWPRVADLVIRGGDIAVHAGAHVAESAVLRNFTVVGDRATVGPDAHLRGAVVLDGAAIGGGAAVEHAIVGHDARVEPSARIGVDAVLGDGVVVGAGVVVPPGARIAAGESVDA